MSEGVPVNVSLSIWCKEHEAQAKPYNNVYITNSMFSALVSMESGKIEQVGDDFPLVFAKVMKRLAKTGKPVCCLLGQDKLDEIMGDAPPATGDKFEDFLEAKDAVPGVQPCHAGDMEAILGDMEEPEKPKKKPKKQG